MIRSVIDVSTGSGDQYIAYKYDGTINTGYTPNRRLLLNSHKKKVINERNKKGVKLRDGKVSKTINELYKIKEY